MLGDGRWSSKILSDYNELSCSVFSVLAVFNFDLFERGDDLETSNNEADFFN